MLVSSNSLLIPQEPALCIFFQISQKHSKDIYQTTLVWVPYLKANDVFLNPTKITNNPSWDLFLFFYVVLCPESQSFHHSFPNHQPLPVTKLCQLEYIQTPAYKTKNYHVHEFCWSKMFSRFTNLEVFNSLSIRQQYIDPPKISNSSSYKQYEFLSPGTNYIKITHKS